MCRLYTLLLWLGLPLVSCSVLWRGLRERAYWQGWGERFGGGGALPVSGRDAADNLWIHAASVGEVVAASPLVEALLQRHPGRALVITSTTPAGRARAAQLFGARVAARYAPYDLPLFVRRALRRYRPALCVVIETELWPNFFALCARAQVPVLVASARLSARTARVYQRFPGLLRAALAANVEVAAQSAADADRYRQLGVPPQRLHVTGNLKFDREPPPGVEARGAALRAQLAPRRALWVGGSTHDPEERYLLEAQRALQDLPGGAPLLVLAPRHRPRFESVAALLQDAGLRFMRRSTLGAGAAPEDLQVLLLDTIGELQDFYAAADVVFVGGSMAPVGGHNLLEAAQLGLPVLGGVHQQNAPDIARALLAVAALELVADPAQLAAALRRWLGDAAARKAAGAAGRGVVLANRGALAGVMALLEPALASAPPAGSRASLPG